MLRQDFIQQRISRFQMFHYMTSVDKTDKVTGEVSRVDHYGNKLSEDEAFSMWPI
jgi:hypothetical protein